MSNHLKTANSPYLLQHAHNPVDWFPWSEAALEKARTENKPIFLSIGYTACHWCHVMAHESFEDAETAALMNACFVNIKVDREERPDLDAIYMQATMALTGSGGWPMSVFLTPDLQPFYAGTYFPPQPRHGLPSFRQVLSGLAEAWQTRQDEIAQVGAQLTAQLEAHARIESNQPFPFGALEDAAIALVQNYDWANGGWGMPPKFPQPMTVEFLLHTLPSPAGRKVGNGGLKAIRHCLEAMSRGGMYDVVGGGFHRYSTDARWLVPHFEKMLYDNALLARACLHAWQVTGEPAYARTCTQTLDFVAREMTHPQGGFYASLDADSEGQEGKFYTWMLDEIREILAEDSTLFEATYAIRANGNWEGRTVLQRALDDASLAARFKLDPEAVPVKLADCHARLLDARVARIRPATDDKILTAWNGLMLAAFAEAARSNILVNKYTSSNYLELAMRNADFILSALRPDGRLRRAWREGQTSGPAFLEDYAALSLGLLELYQTDFNPRWFAAAQELADEMITRFSDPAGGFFDTPADAKSLLIRPKDIQDNATPSGNALAAEALLKLSAFTEKSSYRETAEHALGLVAQAAIRYPQAFARWLQSASFARGPVKQVALAGALDDPSTQAMLAEIRSAYHPNLIVAASAYPPPSGSPALLNDRPLVNGKPAAYVCEGFTCQRPVTTVEELRELLKA